MRWNPSYKDSHDAEALHEGPEHHPTSVHINLEITLFYVCPHDNSDRKVRSNRCWTAGLWTPKAGTTNPVKEKAGLLPGHSQAEGSTCHWVELVVRTPPPRTSLPRDSGSVPSAFGGARGHLVECIRRCQSKQRLCGRRRAALARDVRGSRRGSRSTTVSRFQIGPSREVQRKGRSMDTVIFYRGEL